MKKLLTVSVLAIMAVSTANAEIASTGFVTDRTGTVTGAAFEGLTDADKNLTGAINAIAGRVGSANVDKQIDDAIKNAKVEDLSDGAQYAKTADVVTDAELAGLTGTKDAAAGKVVTGVTTSGGVVTAVSESKITNDFIDDGTISQAKIDGLTTALNSKQGTIADLETIRAGAALGATSLQDADIATSITEDEALAGKLATSGLVAGAISAAISDFTNETDDIRDIANENKAAIEALPTTYASKTTVETAYQDAINTAEADAVAAAKTETTTQVNALADGAVKANTDAIAGMDATYAAQEGKYIASVTQADGKVTATYADLTDVAKMEVPEVCNGTATCALVWNKNTKTLDWEAIMQ